MIKTNGLMTAVLGFAFLAQTSAWACPDYSGQYSCTDGNKVEDASIEQTTTDGVTTYLLKGSLGGEGGSVMELIADAKAHDLPPSESMKNATYTATCAEAAVNVAVQATVLNQGTEFGQLTLGMAVAKDASEALILKVDGKVEGSFGTFPIQQQLTCTVK